MKFAISTLITALVVLVQVSAEPIPTPQTSQAMHCNGPDGLVCPTGFRCCGPFLGGVGGTCFQGTTGICPDI
ncbi:hypothetical protein CPB83DRAFT_450813 [Crepidotus variabilis]|uniref:Uncharacterized protein n=1 Tax=Crepidotus variabilis TaxID=179855 RepID=A0A9P6JNL8_9AGAR|nr:hypothetical protein CPB83DRAFT_450813 [Crepidotus variabilis]